MTAQVSGLPNHQLRRERLRHHWSQKEVAGRLGTTFTNVSRWERGITVPGPYYRARLCTLFDKSLAELGLSASEPLKNEESSPQQRQVSQMSNTSTWFVPYRRNPFFTGREEILKDLYDALHPAQPGACIPMQAIGGLGGIGKTQIALEYAARYHTDYQSVLWVRAETRVLWVTDYVLIADLLQLRWRDEQDQVRIVEAVKRWLQEHHGWLLILDNVQDLSFVSDFIPAQHSGHVLLTTQLRTTGTFARLHQVQKLPLEESIRFLLRRAKSLAPIARLQDVPATDYVAAREICQLLDGLPLALDQAGAYIEMAACGLSGYLVRYHSQRTKLLALRTLTTQKDFDHPQSVVATLTLSLERVKESSPLAADLLSLCAFFHSDAIPEEVLSHGASAIGPVLEPIGADPFQCDAAIAALRGYSLLDRNPETKMLSLHPLVQVVLQESMAEDDQRCWAERMIRALNLLLPEASHPDLWHLCQRYLPHAYVAAAFIARWKVTSPEAGRLLHLLGMYLRVRVQFSEAEHYLLQALSLCEQREEPGGVASNLHELALLYYDQGQYQQAKPYYQRALALGEQLYGPEHPRVATSLNDIGVLYHTLGYVAEAASYYQRALLIRQRMLDAEHPDLAESFNNLGYIHYNQNNMAEAETLFLRALSIQELAFGLQHPYVAITLTNLAVLYLKYNRYSEAEPLLLRAKTIQEQVMGPEHPDLAIVFGRLGILYHEQGKASEAEQFYRQAIELQERVLGPDHPRIVQQLAGLAKLYAQQHDYVQARSLYSRAIAIQEKAVPPDDTDLLTLLEHYERVLTVMERVN